MIGCLYRVKKDVCLPKGTIVIIKGIDADNRFPERHLIGSATCLPVNSEDGFTYGVWVEYLEPIPLTPEILEKNGFYYGYTSNEEDLASNTIVQLSEDDKGWCWDEGCGAIKVIFPNEADGGMLVIDDQSFDRHLEFVYSATIYVHELQHAMRLLGIEKEIIL